MGLDRGFRDAFQARYGFNRRDIRTQKKGDLSEIYTIPYNEKDDKFYYAKNAEKKRVDHLCVDANELIHAGFKAQTDYMHEQEHVSTKGRRSQNRRVAETVDVTIDDEFINAVGFAVIARLKKLYLSFRPVETFYIALDGPCALCKGKEQRSRRYFSVQSVHVSPGTRLMNIVDAKIREWIHSYFAKKNTDKDTVQKIIFSGSCVEGEGEMKIVDFLVNTGWNDSAVIHTPDSDMLSMVLTLPQKNVFVVSNDTFVQKCDITQVIKKAYPKQDEKRVALDQIMLSLLFGNDYIHPIRTTTSSFTPSVVLENYSTCIVDWDNSSLSLDLQAMYDLITAVTPDTNTNPTRVQETKKYLQSLLWCIQSYRTGKCFDYEHPTNRWIDIETITGGLKDMIDSGETKLVLVTSKPHKVHPFLPITFLLYIVPLNHAQTVVPERISDYLSSLQNDIIYGELLKIEPSDDITGKLLNIQKEIVSQMKNTKSEWIMEICSRGKEMTYVAVKRANQKKPVGPTLTLVNEKGQLLETDAERDVEMEEELMGLATFSEHRLKKYLPPKQSQKEVKQFAAEEIWKEEQTKANQQELRQMEKHLKTLNKKLESKRIDERAEIKRVKEEQRAVKEKEKQERREQQEKITQQRKAEKNEKKQKEMAEYEKARKNSMHPLLRRENDPTRKYKDKLKPNKMKKKFHKK
jgi:hypothetical protein